MTLGHALRHALDRYLTARRSPDVICDYLLRAAAEGPGPEGVEGWQDDRTVFVFAVDVGA